MNVNAELLLKEIVNPVVVVAEQVINLDPPFGELLQSRQCTMEAFGNHRAILKPKVKEIAHNEQAFCGGKNMMKKAQEPVFFRLFDLIGAKTQVHVRYEICRHPFPRKYHSRR